jgi:hypothetical protein
MSEATETSLLGKVPVWACLKAGWVFLFTRFGAIAARVWLAAILLSILEARLSIVPTGDVSDQLLATLQWLSGAYLLIYVFVLASLYSLALGAPQRPFLAGLAIGPDELRFLFVVVIYLVIVGVLALGAVIVGRQLIGLVGMSGDIAQLGTQEAITNLRWFDDMNWLQRIVGFAPLAVAAVIGLWFSTRYALVPLHVIAVRRLAIFDAMALTKGNTWRLLLLMLLLGLVLVVFGYAVLAGFDLVSHALTGVLSGRFHSGASGGSGHHTDIFAPILHQAPTWISPVLRTLLNLTALSVVVGTFSEAYRRVTGD